MSFADAVSQYTKPLIDAGAKGAGDLDFTSAGKKSYDEYNKGLSIESFGTIGLSALGLGEIANLAESTTRTLDSVSDNKVWQGFVHYGPIGAAYNLIK